MMEKINHNDLVSAWNRWKAGELCDLCKEKVGGHPTCFGQNLCDDCFVEKGTPCSQIYPGDKGGGLL